MTEMSLGEMLLVLVRLGVNLFTLYAILHCAVLAICMVIEAIAKVFERWLKTRIGGVVTMLAVLWVVLHALVLPLLNIDGWKRFFEVINVFK